MLKINDFDNMSISLSEGYFNNIDIAKIGISNDSLISMDDLNALKDFLLLDYTKDHTMRLINLIINREILVEIFKSIDEGIQIINSDGIIIYVNPAFLRILGVDEKDRIGKNIMEISPDGSLANVLKTGKPIRDLRNRPKGTSIELISNATPIYVNKHMVGAVAIIRDIKDLLSLTEKLSHSEKMVKNLTEKMDYLGKDLCSFDDIIGNSVAIQNVIEMAKIAAKNDSTVLIQGETGTGKDLIAQAIHKNSSRSKKPFISINCSAVSKNLLESEFFGHEKGSFTGAYKRQLGKFELANEGTLFLDEIGEMDISLQVKILRAIQEKTIQRIGGDKEVPLDVRIIAATNRNLNKMLAEGTFREDLYYRLNVWNIVIPPLRERKADIEVLTKHLLSKICRRLGRRDVDINDKAIERLYNYNWPGNVRELENILERAVLNLKSNTISCEDLMYLSQNESTRSQKNVISLSELEKQAIKNALDVYGDSYEAKNQVAEALGISIATLYNKIKKYDL